MWRHIITLYKEWHDFVRHKINTIYTEAERLDTSKAVRVKDRTVRGLLAINQDDMDKYGFVTEADEIISPNDTFEAMEVTSGGAVTIWTRDRVWGLVPYGPIEKLRYFDRHPPDVEADD